MYKLVFIYKVKKPWETGQMKIRKVLGWAKKNGLEQDLNMRPPD